MKKCSKCGNEYPKDRKHFHLKGTYKGKDLLANCRICHNKKCREKYKEKGVRKVTSERTKRIINTLDDVYIAQLIFISLNETISKEKILKNKELLELHRLNLQLKRITKWKKNSTKLLETISTTKEKI